MTATLRGGPQSQNNEAHIGCFPRSSSELNMNTRFINSLLGMLLILVSISGSDECFVTSSQYSSSCIWVYTFLGYRSVLFADLVQNASAKVVYPVVEYRKIPSAVKYIYWSAYLPLAQKSAICNEKTDPRQPVISWPTLASLLTNPARSVEHERGSSFL